MIYRLFYIKINIAQHNCNPDKLIGKIFYPKCFTPETILEKRRRQRTNIHSHYLAAGFFFTLRQKLLLLPRDFLILVQTSTVYYNTDTFHDTAGVDKTFEFGFYTQTSHILLKINLVRKISYTDLIYVDMYVFWYYLFIVNIVDKHYS